MLKLAIYSISFAVVALPSMMVFATSGTNDVNDNNILEVMRSIPYFSFMVLLIETVQIETFFQDESTKNMVFAPINNKFFLNYLSNAIIKRNPDRSFEYKIV